MRIKKTVLKEIIKQVVRESIAERERKALSEAAPEGKKAERMVGHVKKSLKKSHPKWGTDKVKGVAIATTWKARNQGTVEEAGLTSENDPTALAPGMDAASGEDMGGESHGYDEKEEMMLIKVMKLVADKLAAMHGECDLVPKDPNALGGETEEEPEVGGGAEFGAPADDQGMGGEEAEEEPHTEEPTETEPEQNEFPPDDEAGEEEHEEDEENSFPPK